jgi:hypothetical protein
MNEFIQKSCEKFNSILKLVLFYKKIVHQCLCIVFYTNTRSLVVFYEALLQTKELSFVKFSVGLFAKREIGITWENVIFRIIWEKGNLFGLMFEKNGKISVFTLFFQRKKGEIIKVMGLFLELLHIYWKSILQ